MGKGVDDLDGFSHQILRDGNVLFKIHTAGCDFFAQDQQAEVNSFERLDNLILLRPASFTTKICRVICRNCFCN